MCCFDSRRSAEALHRLVVKICNVILASNGRKGMKEKIREHRYDIVDDDSRSGIISFKRREQWAQSCRCPQTVFWRT